MTAVFEDWFEKHVARHIMITLAGHCAVARARGQIAKGDNVTGIDGESVFADLSVNYQAFDTFAVFTTRLVPLISNQMSASRLTPNLPGYAPCHTLVRQ